MSSGVEVTASTCLTSETVRGAAPVAVVSKKIHGSPSQILLYDSFSSRFTLVSPVDPSFQSSKPNAKSSFWSVWKSI